MNRREESEYDKTIRRIRAGEHPKEEAIDGPIGDVRITHPAFGSISAGRVSGSRLLFGSDFKHQHYVTIAISRADQVRGLSHDYTFPRDEIIEVALSEAQWATFVSSLNSGATECTLTHLNRELIPEIASVPDKVTQFDGELKERLKLVEDAAKQLQQEIERGGKKTVMRDLIGTLIRNLTPNLSYVAEQFGRHMERTTEAAKVEVNAYITGQVQRAGLKALAESDRPINTIEHKDKA